MFDLKTRVESPKAIGVPGAEGSKRGSFQRPDHHHGSDFLEDEAEEVDKSSGEDTGPEPRTEG